MSYMHTWGIPDNEIPEESRELYDKVKKLYADQGLYFVLLYTDGYRTKGKATYHFSVERPFKEGEPIDERLRGPLINFGLFNVSIPGLHVGRNSVRYGQEEVLSYSIDEALNLALLIINANDNKFHELSYQYKLIDITFDMSDDEKLQLRDKLNKQLYPDKFK